MHTSLGCAAKGICLLLLCSTAQSSGALAAPDPCERDDTITTPGEKRAGQFPFEDGSLKYDSRRQINRYGERRYIWCIENSVSSYNATVHWGDDDKSDKHYGGIVGENNTRGKYVDDSRDIVIDQQNFHYWRSFGTKHYEYPETVFQQTKNSMPRILMKLIDPSSLFVGKAMAEDRSFPELLEELDSDSRIFDYILDDKSIDLAKLVQDGNALAEYVGMMGQLRRTAYTVFDMPGSAEAIQSWLDGNKLADEDIVTLNFGFSSIIRPIDAEGENLQASIAIFYRAWPHEGEVLLERTLSAMEELDIRIFIESTNDDIIAAWSEVSEISEAVRVHPTSEFAVTEVPLGHATVFEEAEVRIGLRSDENALEIGVLEAHVFEPR